MPASTAGLCRILASPIRWLPRRLHAGGLSLVLNHLLAHALADGELDFLRGKVVSLEVTDLGLTYRLCMAEEGFAAAPHEAEPDVRFSGDTQTFLSLATQREDADSLFFQRRLRIEGSTATGLHLKNFLDALGEPRLPVPAREALRRFADLHARHCAAPDAYRGVAGGVNQDAPQARQLNPGRPAQ